MEPFANHTFQPGGACGASTSRWRSAACYARRRDDAGPARAWQTRAAAVTDLCPTHLAYPAASARGGVGRHADGRRRRVSAVAAGHGAEAIAAVERSQRAGALQPRPTGSAR